MYKDVHSNGIYDLKNADNHMKTVLRALALAVK